MTSVLQGSSHPRLTPHLRLTFDRVRQQHLLLGPESVSVLNPTGAAILDLCDGSRTVTEIVTELRGRYTRVPSEEVERFLAHLVTKRCVEVSDD
jgi:pyrroloquinoline quinone biosynthesis protein D